MLNGYNFSPIAESLISAAHAMQGKLSPHEVTGISSYVLSSR